MTHETDLLTSLGNGVLTVTFNRPEFRNAFSSTTSPRLRKILSDARTNKAVRCIVFQGSGTHFSGGGDVASFRKALENDRAERQAEFSERLDNLGGVIRELKLFDRPIVASLRGGVAGAALAFPLAADLVLADETTNFVFAHLRLGIVPDGGLSYLLPRVVGERIARRLILSGGALNADQAKQMGIVDTVMQPEKLEEATASAACAFARAPQRAMKAAKKLLLSSHNYSLEEQLALEKAGIVDCVADNDFDEGVKAFLEKRSPKFPSTI